MFTWERNSYTKSETVWFKIACHILFIYTGGLIDAINYSSLFGAG